MPLQPPLTKRAEAPGALTAALAEIEVVANELCDHLADEQFARVARIRALAKSAMAMNGDH
ncbi:hypothetical protein [Streptomyces erythrochromogenes]|uniref:hypothetical protein n=1 Tax=Streptomyces erythrochromogenes TaxID=285574 RepID=UPI0036C95473